MVSSGCADDADIAQFSNHIASLLMWCFMDSSSAFDDGSLLVLAQTCSAQMLTQVCLHSCHTAVVIDHRYDEWSLATDQSKRAAGVKAGLRNIMSVRVHPKTGEGRTYVLHRPWVDWIL
jgi:hypothetical protein